MGSRAALCRRLSTWFDFGGVLGEVPPPARENAGLRDDAGTDVTALARSGLPGAGVVELPMGRCCIVPI